MKSPQVTVLIAAMLVLCACGGAETNARTLPRADVVEEPTSPSEPVRFTLPEVSVETSPASEDAGARGSAQRVLSSSLGREVIEMAFHPTRPLLVVVAVDGTVLVVSSRTFDVVFARRVWVRSERNYTIAFDPSGRHVAISATQGLGQQSEVEVLDLDTGMLGAAAVARPGSSATKVSWLSPTRLAWIERRSSEERAELVVQDRGTNVMTRTEIPVTCNEVFPARGVTLLSCRRRGQASLMRLLPENESNLQERAGRLLAVHPGGALLAVAGADRQGAAGEEFESVLISELDGTVRARFAFPEGVSGPVGRARFSVDGTRLLVALGPRFRERVILFERDGTATALDGQGGAEFSADLQRGVRFQGRQLEFIERGEVVQQRDGSGALPAISASGDRIAVSSNGGLSLRAWDDLDEEHHVASGRLISLWGAAPLDAGVALYGRGFVVPLDDSGVGQLECGGQGSSEDARAAALANRCGPALGEVQLIHSNRSGAHVIVKQGKLMVARNRRPIRLRLDDTTEMCIYPDEEGCTFDMDDAGRIVVVAGSAAPVAFNARTGRVMHRFGDGWAAASGLTGDGRLFLARGREDTVLFAARSGRERLTIPARATQSAVGTSVVAVETERDDVRSLRVFTSGGEERFAREGFASSAISILLDEARGRLIRKSADGVEVLDLATGAEVARFPVGAEVGVFDGGMFACAAGALTHLDEGGAQVRSFGQACDRVFGVAPSRNGAFVALMQRDQATVIRVADEARLVIRRVKVEDDVGFWFEREDGRFEAPPAAVEALRVRSGGALEEASVSGPGDQSSNLVAEFFSGS